MKVCDILGGRIHHLYPEYESAEKARARIYPGIDFLDIPDWVGEGWGYNPQAEGDERFIAPKLQEGWYWDENGNPWNAEVSRRAERDELIKWADSDVLEAYRKQRARDTTIDWGAWIDALENFIAEVEATKDQEGYPKTVKYPDYPTKPS